MSGFRYVTDWQRLDPADGEAICAMWQRDHALTSGHNVAERLSQVVAHVLDERGNIAAVSTVETKILPRLGQPMYYYRCFVATPYRDGKLVRPLLRHTQNVLEDYARANGYPCIGVLLELENEGFAGTLRWAHWPNIGFSYIGISPRGLELRVWYFRGAKLKTPEEMAALAQAKPET